MHLESKNRSFVDGFQPQNPVEPENFASNPALKEQASGCKERGACLIHIHFRLTP
jgi:hypothetical protein